MIKITSNIFLRVIVQYLSVHFDSYLKILVVFLLFHKLFSTLIHLNVWNGFHTIYFEIFRSLEYIELGDGGFVCIDISSCYQNFGSYMVFDGRHFIDHSVKKKFRVLLFIYYLALIWNGDFRRTFSSNFTLLLPKR